MTDEPAQNGFLKFNGSLGRNTFSAMETLGHWGKLLGESLFWLVAGPKLKQPVRTGAVLVKMMATTSLKRLRVADIGSGRRRPAPRCLFPATDPIGPVLPAQCHGDGDISAQIEWPCGSIAICRRRFEREPAHFLH